MLHTHTPNPGQYIYSPSCVHLCMFVLCVCEGGESKCVDLRALQGCEARRSERQKIPPAVFGLVSARRKPGTMLHVQYPEVGPPRENFIRFLFLCRSGTQTSTRIHRRGFELTCRCVSDAIRLICGNFPRDVASFGSHATRKLTNLSMFRGKKTPLHLKLL